MEWTEQILKDLDTRPDTLETEVHAVRIGDVFFASQPSELFSSPALDLRKRWPPDDLFLIGCANGSVSYMPDEYDIARKSYAATQSAKFMGNFPFTAESGPTLIDAMLEALERT